MTEIIRSGSFYIECLAFLLSFLFSLRLVKNKAIPKYMQGFFWYPTIGFILILIAFFGDYTTVKPGLSNVLNNLSLVFHFCFLSVFIIRVMPGKSRNRFLFPLFGLFVSVILLLLIKNNITKQVNQAFSISNFGLTTFCIIYYYKLFNNIPIINLRTEASFWIITGIFCCMSINIPIFSTTDYLLNKTSLFNLRLLYNVPLLAYAIMHVFFIKGYLCAINNVLNLKQAKIG